MARRIHTPAISVGQTTLDPRQAHHLRDVLRLGPGDAVELFDDQGAVAPAIIRSIDAAGVVVEVQEIQIPLSGALDWTIATAIPKGERADWLVEKLSELGATRFVPLIAQRSVVVPQGKNKLERWQRIATESAKQSRRTGVMQIEPPTHLQQAIELLCPPGAAESTGWYLTTEQPAVAIHRALAAVQSPSRLSLFIGPEGGWTEPELDRFHQAGLTGVALTRSILRVETAAVAAAAIVAAVLLPQIEQRNS